MTHVPIGNTTCGNTIAATAVNNINAPIQRAIKSQMRFIPLSVLHAKVRNN
jgi:hypothetical protein